MRKEEARKKEITIEQAMLEIPSDRIDQIEGNYELDCKACVGAHLAHIIDGKKGYKDGEKALLRLLQEKHPTANMAHLHFLLRKAGAPFQPFGPGSWYDFEDIRNEFIKIVQNGLPSLRGAYLFNVDLKGAYLHKADLGSAYLYKAFLEKTNLIKANMHKADLQSASLSDSDMYNVNLSMSCLIKANLHRVNLYKANMYGANLCGADLSRAYLYKASLACATYDSDTTYPDDFSPFKAGMRKIKQNKLKRHAR